MPAPSKRDKQSVKRHEQNKVATGRLKNFSRNFYRAIDAGDTETARELRDRSQRAFDKAAGKGTIHRNKAARKVARLDKALAKHGSE